VVNQDDVIARLERLQQLRDAGVITQAELETQKAALLGHAGPVTCTGCGAPLQVTADGRCIYCGTAAPQPSRGVQVSDDQLADSIYAAFPGKKIAAIKELRARTGLDLKDAKDRIEAAERRAQR
jgi:hypothetical protein